MGERGKVYPHPPWLESVAIALQCCEPLLIMTRLQMLTQKKLSHFILFLNSINLNAITQKLIIEHQMLPGNPYSRGRISTIDLLVLNSLDRLLLYRFFFIFTKRIILTRRSTVLRLPFQ